jgi:transposase
VGKKTGPNPTDRAKSGTKRSLLTDGAGVPLGVAVAGANRPDFKLARETLSSVPVEWPEPTPEEPQGLSVDKGYDDEEVRELAEEFLYTLHLRTRGEEAKEVARTVGYRARRWVVERTHSWLNRFRRILIRWEKKGENYLGMLHLACAISTFRASGLLG